MISASKLTRKLRKVFFTDTIVLAQKGHFGLRKVKINLDKFDSHMYVVGKSGQGKSKLIQGKFCQTANSWEWGCGLLDPHADLANDVLVQLATTPRGRPWLSHEKNLNRLIYVDPARDDYLIPFNVLKSNVFTPYEIAENVVEAFRRIWPKALEEAPRFSQILRNTVLVLVINNLTLLEVEPLLTQKHFRDKMLLQVEDTQVVSFFHNQFDKWGKDQHQFISPVLNKVSALLFQPSMKRMLGAKDNFLDFREIMDKRKVLIVNLGAFKDKTTKRLLGSLIITFMGQVAFTRENVPPDERVRFLLTIDEFPSFFSDFTTLAEILSETRKYGLHMGLAHQTSTQIEGSKMEGAIENAKLKIISGVGRKTAQDIISELYHVDLSAIKHEIKDEKQKEKSHPLYQSIPEQSEEAIQKLRRLKRRQVYIQLPDTEEIIEGVVPKVPKRTMGAKALLILRRNLAQRLGTPVTLLNKQILERHKAFGLVSSTPAAESPVRNTYKPKTMWRRSSN